MKGITIVLFGLLLLPALAAGPSAVGDEKGIRFFEGTWQEALELASRENKPVFVDVYATWCGPCKMLKATTFKNKEAGDYFNEYFINVTIDAEKGEGVKLAQQYGVSAYPTLLVVDGNGEPVTGTMGYHRPKDLIAFGKKALKKWESTQKSL